jgi:hypothetical protein
MKTTEQKLRERERQYFATKMKTQRDQATGKVSVFYEGRNIGQFKNYLQAKEQGPTAIQQKLKADKPRQSRTRPGEVRTTALTSGRGVDNVRTR